MAPRPDKVSVENSGVHARDVLRFVAGTREGNGCALIVVTSTEGGGVRAPGAIMAVRADGAACGYVSNGCVDADVVAQACAAMDEGTVRHVRYGTGSPFKDVRLPCGGAIDLAIVPNPPAGVIEEASDALAARRPAHLAVDDNGLSRPDDLAPREGAFVFICTPPMKIRIAGRGEEPLAMARLGAAAGFDVFVQSPDAACLSAAGSIGAATAPLVTPGTALQSYDDPYTAVVLMFHDHDWEVGLLKEALSGPAFYVGALGSRRTHAARCEALRLAGASAQNIERINAPIGLVPRTREAPMLAASTLAEIVAAWQEAFA
ncbi:MAG: XdhC family protein [Pseudomonadota bacterium]